MKVHTRLLLGLVLGVLLGGWMHGFAGEAWIETLNTSVLQPIGQIFLRLIFMVVVPLVFSALVLGVYELGKGHSLGKVAARTVFFTVIATTLSVLIGVTLVNLVRPGVGLQGLESLPKDVSAVQKIESHAQAAKPFAQTLVELVPKNPIDSAVRALEGEMISLMVFALIFGFAMSIVLRREAAESASEVEREPVLPRLLDQVLRTCMEVIHFAMRLAPVAVFAIVFNTAFKLGLDVFKTLFVYVAIVVIGLLIQQFVVYSFLLKAFARRSPLEFFRQCREVYLYAFSTASSNATLPRALELADVQLRLPSRISRFVLTVGSTANQNGTALFEGVTVLFLAQVYGVDLSLAQQVQVVVMSILAGIGTAGVPGGSLPLIMILLTSLGIPAEGLGLILGVDRFLDMCRTTLNVSGDLVLAAIVSHQSGVEFSSMESDHNIS
ncbi:MAG: dicarboxylate/amino acid:cation symporter [Bdellovibrionaceae bacterium]|nr:dicarboxylate/amino acid:cation symporter [Pseudobdellovibrionaceae bacterium]